MGDSEDNPTGERPHASHSLYEDKIMLQWPILVELSNQYQKATDPTVLAEKVLAMVQQHTKMGEMTHETITSGQAQVRNPEQWMQLNVSCDLTLRVKARKTLLFQQILEHQCNEHARLNPIFDYFKTDISGPEYENLQAAVKNFCLQRMRLESEGGFSAYGVQAEFEVNEAFVQGSVDFRYAKSAEEVQEALRNKIGDCQKDKFVIDGPLYTIEDFPDAFDDRKNETPHGPSEGALDCTGYYDKQVYRNVAQSNKINQAKYLAMHMVQVVLEKGRQDIQLVVEHHTKQIDIFKENAGDEKISENDSKYIRTTFKHLNALYEFMHAADDDKTGLAYKMRTVCQLEAKHELLYECPETKDQQSMLDNVLKYYFKFIKNFGARNNVVYCNAFDPYIPKGSTDKEYRVEMKEYFGPFMQRKAYKDEDECLMRAPVMLPIKTRTKSGEVLPLKPLPFGIEHPPEFYLYNEWGQKTVGGKKQGAQIKMAKSFFTIWKAKDKDGKDVGTSYKQQNESAVRKKKLEDHAKAEKAGKKKRKADASSSED